MKTDKYTQCQLVRGGNTFQTAWIPSKFATQNRALKIKNDDGKWINGWIVNKIYGTRSAERVEERGNDHRQFAEVLA